MSPQTPSRRFLFGVLGAFVLLSGADLLLTWLLLSAHHSEVLESNPIAAWILENFGWSGMSVFKLTMVAIIAAIALVVTQRRPRTGELVLVFGCGAQAAIVVSSIFMISSAQPIDDLSDLIAANQGEYREPSALPAEAVALLVRKQIQAELKLSDSQIIAIGDIARLRFSLSHSGGRLGINDLTARAEQIGSYERSFMGELSPKQIRRLRELAWQYRGPLAFADDDVADALQFSDAQIEVVLTTIDRINSEQIQGSDMRVHSVSIGGQQDDAVADAKAKLLTLLTAQQRSKWNEMQGRPFIMEPGISSQVTAAAGH